MLLDMPADHEALVTLLFYECTEVTITQFDPARVIMENKTSHIVAGAVVGEFLE